MGAVFFKKMKNYTITVYPPESKKAPMWSAYCKEWGFTAENETPTEALSSLFDLIRIAEEDEKIQHTFHSTTFKIPTFS